MARARGGVQEGVEGGVWNRHERKPEKKLIGTINIMTQQRNGVRRASVGEGGEWQDVTRQD